ncbi:M48 family metallopeptidase [Geoalkalibacter halelectricus]|uniref:M48 family metallopeptidase n=1 Tax=Geoalkalibacter halelectricus TaxID=2847045 RepID=UPI003D1E2D46
MKWFLLAAFVAVVGFEYWLSWLNLRHLRRHGQEIPAEFAGVIDGELLARTSAYTRDRNRVGLIESLLGNLLLALFLFGGWVAIYDAWIDSLSESFLLSGLLFFLGLGVVRGLLDVPFNLYHHFVIEERYGFNTLTWRLWFSDLLKGTLISLVLMGLLLTGALWLVQASPAWWWLWVWGFFALFSQFVMYVSPYVIEPLFFKFEPVRRPGLEERITALMERAGLKVSRVFQVDASRRSRHSNAYFTGIGRVKRIVLFDTLIEQMDDDEILAVLAHEVGHWKKRHVLKRLVVAQALALVALFAAHHLITAGVLPGLLGLEQASFFAQILILSLLATLIGFPLAPLSSWLSRRDEYQADHFAVELSGAPEALASGLVTLSRENLANLHPHPWYAAFHYSHPPVVERVRALRRQATAGA